MTPQKKMVDILCADNGYALSGMMVSGFIGRFYGLKIIGG
mgnify:CR=1 FL=1